MSAFNEPYFHDEQAAFAKLESLLWPNGQPEACPHCGGVGRINRLAPQRTKRSAKHPEGKAVYGLWKCYHCKGKFTVRKDTVFEESHVELHLWFQAAYLLASSKKGISSNQLHRTLGVTLKTAWFMSHRLREAMRVLHMEAVGGPGRTVEMDETYVGGKERNKHAHKRTPHGQDTKEAVISLVERGGKVRSYHAPAVNARNLGKILRAQLRDGSKLYTDQLRVYRSVSPIRHRPTASVNHSIGEYVRGDVHTNTIESYFSILKRGIVGTYHHVSEQHLKRYLAEFDFRYNERQALGVDDSLRANRLLQGIVGKRLTYLDSSE